jgi:hypothetical protein
VAATIGVAATLVGPLSDRLAQPTSATVAQPRRLAARIRFGLIGMVTKPCVLSD